MRKLIARIVIMLAVLAMPLGMTPAAASAHSMPMTMNMQHCPEPASGGKAKGAIAACTMACASALPAIDLAREEPPMLRTMPVVAVVERKLEGLHPETATPPPRLG